jgi:predicted amidohydrolase
LTSQPPGIACSRGNAGSRQAQGVDKRGNYFCANPKRRFIAMKGTTLPIRSLLFGSTLMVLLSATACTSLKMSGSHAEVMPGTRQKTYPVTEVIFPAVKGRQEGLTIALANIENHVCVKAGCDASIEENKRKMVAVIDQLKKLHVNMILFPEFSLTGYFWGGNHEPVWAYMNKGVMDKHKAWLKRAIQSRLGDELKYIIFNSIRDNPKTAGNKKKFLNSTYVIDKHFDCDDFSADEKTHIYDKTFLPGIENDYTTTKKTDFLVIETEWGKFGFTTCYDMCFAQLYQEYALVHKVNAIIQLASWRATGSGKSGKRKYKLICNGEPCDRVSENYWGFQWDTMISDRAATNQVWMIGANAVGYQKRGNYQFWGGSGLWAPSGIKIAEASHSAEELIIFRNVPIIQQYESEETSFDLKKDFDRVYAPVPNGSGCIFKHCGSFTRWANSTGSHN